MMPSHLFLSGRQEVLLPQWKWDVRLHAEIETVEQVTNFNPVQLMHECVNVNLLSCHSVSKMVNTSWLFGQLFFLYK
jgi:hypothetical protein